MALKSKVAKVSKPQKPKREIQVVQCPTGFPPFNSNYERGGDDDHDETQQKSVEEVPTNNYKGRKDKTKLLDWHDTAKEIRAYGATAFERKQKRDYQDEQYKKLTGRHKKKQRVPLPIVRGIKKKAAERDAKHRVEARKAGIILPKIKKPDAQSRHNTNGRTIRNYGPAPSIGFMKKGMFRVKKDR